MKCTKSRFAFRPLVENLESRLQPGYALTRAGYGWSLLADDLSILNQEALELQGPSCQDSSPPGEPTKANALVAARRDSLEITIASVAASRTQSSNPSSSMLAGNLVAGLPADDSSSVSLTGHGHSLPLAAVAAPTTKLPAPATPVGSAPQSPVGASTPAARLQTAGKTLQTPQLGTAPAPAPVKLDGQVVALAPLKSGPHFHVTTQQVQSGQVNPNVIITWSSFLGRGGDDRLLGVALDPRGGRQPLVVAGFTQNPSDPTDFAGVVARVSTDGTSATLFTMDLGSNTRTEFHSTAVDPNDSSIYVNGQITQNGITTDLIARINASLNTVYWTMSHQPNASATGNGVHLDSAGQDLYATGAMDGNTYVTKLTNLGPSGPTTVFDAAIQFTSGTSTGNAVAPDSAGNADLAVQVQKGNDTIAVAAQFAAGGSGLNWSMGYPSPGPNGTMNGVYVDSADNVFVTGGVIDHWASVSLLDTLTASFDNAGNPQGGMDVYYYAPNHDPAQCVGFNLQINPFNGRVFVAITIGVPMPGIGLAGNIDFLALDQSLGRVTGDEGGYPFGSNDDENRGLVCDTTRPAVYQVGFSSSPDFTTTADAFQPNYGGGPFDGVVIGYISI